MRISAIPTLLLLLIPTLAGAASVTSIADDGDGSLRQALAGAADGDTIDFALATPATITLASALVVDKNVSIVGPGASLLTIDGNHAARVFRVSPLTSAAISDLTMANGSSGVDGGGCLFNDGATLTLTHVVVHDCSGVYGGGILNDATNAPAVMHLVESTVRDNQATSASGGGLYNDGTTNTATVVIERCTVSGNHTTLSDSSGGGVINSAFDGHAVMDVRGSTISGNAANGPGGGVTNSADSNGIATLRIANSTFALNTGDTGGAVYNVVLSGSGDLEIGNTLLVAAAGGSIAKSGGTITSRGFNLASDAAGGDGTTGPGGVLDAASDRRNTNPQVGALKANGGPTFTHALLAGSPAIDQGRRDTIAALADGVDQRGFTRPADDPSVVDAAGGDGSDVGAFEAQVEAPRDLAVTALKVPKSVTLKTGKPPVVKTIKVTIQNRSASNEVVADGATLAALVAVQGSALGGGCAAPVATLTPGKTKLPATIKPKKKLTAVFSATFACAVDPAKTTKKDPGHSDFRWVATVDRSVLGAPDAHDDDDVCPRPTLPNGVDPRPDPAKPIKDVGCGGKLPDKTLGADVVTDVVGK